MMDAEERELFGKGIHHATTTSSGADLDRALDALGWRDALALDTASTVATVFEQQGGAATTSSALDVVLATALGLDIGAETVVVMPALGSTEPPGTGSLDVRGLATSVVTDRPRAVVVSDDGVVHVVDTSALTARAVSGLDPRLGLVELTGARIASLESTPLTGTWPAAIAAGQRAIAHELVGVSRTMLRLARDHAVERVQFDRAIAGFQAVRHRLAESLVAIEGADAAALAAGDDGTPLTAALAKAIAGRSARTVARHSQQVLAGIGFTTEHPFHHYLRRVLVLDHLLGDARSLTVALGDQLLVSSRLPSLLPL
jgi:hypothetical protein